MRKSNEQESTRVLRVRAGVVAVLDKLARLPLASSPPVVSAQVVSRLQEMIRVYPPVIYRAIAERAERYDRAWGVRGESEVAAFLDFQCLRCRRSLRTFIPSKPHRLPAWQEYIQTKGVTP